MGHICCKKAAFLQFSGLHLDLKNFWTVVGLGLSSKKSGLDLDHKIW